MTDAALHDPPTFYACFLQELRRHKWPAYPTAPWHICLRLACEADACSYREIERHKLDAEHYWQVGYRQQYRVKEQSGNLAPGDRSAAIRQLEKRCDEFLISRGLERGGFHAY